jgi:4-hydroxy-2,2'-bipyrrole-5-methanol dehydrogenase
VSGERRALADTPAFLDALGTAASVAARSPSSHNCQPWALAALVTPRARAAAGRLLGEPGGRQYLALAIDRERSLTALPAHLLEMTLSCGMYWGLLADALTALSWQVTATRFAVPAEAGTVSDQWPAGWSLLSVASLGRGPEDPAALAALDDLAARRRTNRGPYRAAAPGAPPPGPPYPGGSAVIRHVHDAQVRAAVARLIARHGGRDFAHRRAWRETHSFIRRDDADARQRGDGFTLEHLLGTMSRPRRQLMRAALAPATMRALSLAGYHRLLAAQLAGAVRGSPGLVVVTTRHHQPGTGELVMAGAAIIRYWLQATRQGLALHPVSVLLQHDDVRRRLQDLLGVPGRPVFLARLGTPAASVPPTPRHPARTSWHLL